MHIIKKQVKNLDVDLYKDIVEKYLNYAVNLKFSNSFLLADLLRHSLCSALNLESNASCTAVYMYVEECKKELLKVIPKSYLDNASIANREALLEACVHCIEMSIEKAEV